MSNIKGKIDAAEVAADIYLARLRVGGVVDLNAERLAREDFIAGWDACHERLINVAETWSADKEMVVQQLQHLHDLAKREGEFYSANVAATTLKKLGYEP